MLIHYLIIRINMFPILEIHPSITSNISSVKEFFFTKNNKSNFDNNKKNC